MAAKGHQIRAEEWGQLLDQAAAPILEAYFHRHDELVAPRPLLNGNEIKQELGLSSGPQIGRIINSLVEEQAAGVITTRDEAVQFAKQQTGYSPGHS
jgi:tRNA nucleotidyltransferase (CCA-adding enzyme)